jgi:hypothetical protein
MPRWRNWKLQATERASYVVNRWSMVVKKEEKEPAQKNYGADIFCISIVYEVGLNDNKVVQLGIVLLTSSNASRRPVLEETPRQAPQVIRLPVGGPPMPGQDPVPMPIQLPVHNIDIEAQPAVPGAQPTIVVRGVQRVAGGPVTLPPGYSLPPGWAVIPAHNVQIIPPGQNPAGIQNVQFVGPQTGQGGPVPAEGNPDTPIAPNDHATTPGPATTTTNAAPINTQPGSTPNTTDIPNNTTNNAAPPNMPRATPRIWASQSAHPSFPIAVPLFPTASHPHAGAGIRSHLQAASSSATTGRATEPIPSTSYAQVTPNGVANTSDMEDRHAVLQQMTQHLRNMEDLVARMSILLPPPSRSAESVQVSPVAADPPAEPISTSPTNGHMSDSSLSSTSSLSSPGRTSTPHTVNILKKRRSRSFSPVERTNENEPHIRRLSSSEDDLSPEELADIRAPWVEPLDQELPLHDAVHSPHQGSPPRMRAESQSPNRLARRGSLLKHDITNEMLEERGRERLRNADLGEMAQGSVKGKEVAVDDENSYVVHIPGSPKGKEVAVEDGEEE